MADAGDLPLIDEHGVDVDAPVEAVWAEVTGRRWRRFHVERSTPMTAHVLAGRHPFARYRLTFFVDDLGDGRSRVRAESRAAFPGPHGAAHRLLVIGTGFHVLAVRRLLDGIRRPADARP